MWYVVVIGDDAGLDVVFDLSPNGPANGLFGPFSTEQAAWSKVFELEGE